MEEQQTNFLQRNYELFLEKIQQQSLGMVNTDTSVFVQQNSLGLATVMLQKQIQIDKLTQKLQNELFVNILYSMKNVNKRDAQALAYSMPYDEDMYVIQMESHAFGMISRLDVIFYQSIDVMFKHINKRYQSLTDNGWEFSELETPEAIFSRFAM